MCTRLVESVIQRFVEVLQVEQYNRLARLHAHLDSVYVPTHLWNMDSARWNNLQNHTYILYTTCPFYCKIQLYVTNNKSQQHMADICTRYIWSGLISSKTKYNDGFLKSFWYSVFKISNSFFFKIMNVQYTSSGLRGWPVQPYQLLWK